jgi:hypothetical protein
LRDLPSEACRRSTEIFLVNNAVLIDDESHDARITISSRIGQKREAACQMAIDDVIPGPARRVLSLPAQNLEIVPIIRPWFEVLAARAITGRSGAGNERAQRALLFAGLYGPI